MKKIIRKVKLRTWIGGFLILILLPIAVFAVYSAEASPNPPTGYWALNEGAGTTAQNSGSSSTTGTITGATWANEDMCLSGKCLQFDGDGDYISFGDNYDMGTGDMTISMWFRTTDTDYSLIAKSYYAATDGRYAILNDTNAGLTGFFDSGDNKSTSPAVTGVSDNKWHHVEVVYDRDANMTIYIDGSLYGSISISVDSADNVQGSNILLVGSYNDIAGTGVNSTVLEFKGFIDEIKIYNYGRTESQIKTDLIKNGSARGSSAVMGTQDLSFLNDSLSAHWKMDEVAANTCTGGINDSCDSSGNSLDGAWNGNTTTTATSKFGSATTHDGTGDYIQLSNSSLLSPEGGDFTISTWFKTGTSYPSGTNSQGYIYNDYGAGGNPLVRLTVGDQSTSVLQCAFRDGSGNILVTSSTSTVNDSLFHLATCVKIGTNTYLYLDGSLVDSEGSPSLGSIDVSGGDNPRIASYTSAADEHFAGQLDDFRIYKKGLSSKEVSTLYNWGPKPINHWGFDENTGQNVYDTSGNGSNGFLGADATAESTDPVWATGRFGSALNFDGSDDKVTIGDFAVMDAVKTISISAWLYVPTYNFNYKRIVTKADSGESDGFVFDLAGASQKLRLRINNSDCESNTNTVTGSWYHAAGTYDGSNIRIYINGVLDKTCAYSTAITANNWNLVIGDRSDGNSRFLGIIDDVRIYNYARNANQVIEDMNGSHPIGGSPIGSEVIHWKLDDGVGATAYNSIAGFTNGSVSNALWKTKQNCKTNGCLLFDGTGDVVSIATASDSYVDFNATESFTGSAWVYSTTLPANGDQDAIIAKWDSTTATSEGYKLFLDGDSTTAHFGVTISDESQVTTISASASDNTASANTWYHIAFTFNGGTAGAAGDLKLYIDGKLVASNSTNSSFLGLEDVTSDFTVGDYDATDAVATNTGFTGYIDEIKIYGTALTSDQIKIDLNSGSVSNFGSSSDSEDSLLSGGAGNPPYAYYNFDENTGTTATNRGTTSGNNGTLNLSSFRNGKHGSAIYFNGDSTSNGSSVVIPDDAFDSLSQGTISFWFKPDDKGDSFQEMFGVANGPTNSLALEIAYAPSSNQVQIWTTGCASGAIDQTAGTGAVITNPTDWHHFAYVVNATDTYIYVDGILTATSTADCFFDEISSGTTNYTVGCVHWDSSTACFNNEMFEGLIDDLKIYDYPRSKAQISYDFNGDSPLFYWKFDECTGATAYDSGIKSLNGTLTPGTTGNTSAGDCSTASTMRGTGADAKYGSGLDFDGGDDYVSVSDSNGYSDFEASSDDFSIFTWIKRDTTGEQNIISKEDADNDGWRLVFNSSNQVVCSVDAVDITSSSSITDTSWHFIGCTIDRDGNGQVYIDGKANGSATAISSEVMAIASTSFVVGTRNYTPSGALYFNGLLDEIQIYSYNLTPAQVKKMYNQNSGARFGPTTGRP